MPAMANHRAIAGIGNSIVGLLAEKCPKAEFPGATFKLCQPSDFQQSKRLRFGISLCLYQVSTDATQRNLPNRPTPPDGWRLHPPLPLALHFLLTAWAKTSERQHDLLGWAMCILNDNPMLPSTLLNHFTGGAGDVFSRQESIEVVLENLDLERMKAVCELVQIRQQPSIAYVARRVAIQTPSS
jgi:hypothetical protein